MDLRIISIGTLAANPLWGERTPVRTGHATTTLIRAAKRAILVDPGLPAPVLVARLKERAGIGPGEVTHIFLTSFNPEGRRAIAAFENAAWWIGENEREQIGAAMVARLHEAAEEGDQDLRAALELDIAILHRCEGAPDSLASEGAARIDLFPLPGVSPGLCGVLAAGARHTTLICGDAIPTVEHLEHGQVLPGAADVDRARESFAEAVEIADVLVPGRDNMVLNPTRRPF